MSALRLMTAGALLCLVALMAAGAAPVGRVVLHLGLPRLALPLLSAPADRGTALFRAGEHARAAEAFAAAGDRYSQGLAATMAGDYATALATWDRHLTAHPDDHEARANRDLVARLMAGTRFEAVAPPETPEPEGDATLANPGQGKARAAGSGDEASNPNAGFWMPEIASSGLRRVPNIFDAQFIVANDRWLTTLEDQPGLYLRARLAAEYKARVAAGTALPPAGDAQ